MEEAYLGVDIGSISTKGVIIDEKITRFWPVNIFGQKATRWAQREN